MLLYLVRHAEAVERDAPGAGHDFDRALTPHGHAQTRALAEAFARLNLTVDEVVTSPLVRAYQTAAGLVDVWRPGAKPITFDALAPERLKPAKLSEFLGDVFGDRVAAVGHMPDLGAYAEWLLGIPAGSVQLAKGAAACIEFKGDPAKGEGKLHWLVSSEWVM